MNRIICATGIAFVFLFFTGFHNIEETTETIEIKVIPQEKREILNKIVGRWITQTNIHARNGQLASKVIGSDVWQWSPDGNFLLHIGYGIHDKSGFGAMEITGYNSKTGGFNSYNFNPDGSFSMGTLTIDNNIWIWNGKDMRSSGKDVRTTGVMEGKILTVKHEISDDSKTYELFMDGVLTKGSDF
ncbi:MAG TPA: DUF1579 family protein [Cyclobacteriaceae bacterium]